MHTLIGHEHGGTCKKPPRLSQNCLFDAVDGLGRPGTSVGSKVAVCAYHFSVHTEGDEQDKPLMAEG